MKIDDKKKRIECFLEELADLTKYYGVEVCGCGCCGSPYLMFLEDGEIPVTDICYSREKEKYSYYDKECKGWIE